MPSMVELLFLQLLSSLHICSLISPVYTINLYRTDQSETSLQYDCLDYYVTDTIVAYSQNNAWAHQLITYCIRPSIKSEQLSTPERLERQKYIDAQNFTFDKLKSKNITEEQLLAWSANIELVERYKAFIIGKSELDRLEVYYNCTPPWFGKCCQYALSLWDEVPFTDIVFYAFDVRTSYEPVNVTCYVLLKCNRGSLAFCLDWREICDQKIDCVNDGVDEEHCWQLDTSDSNDYPDEFRCHNGMHTIPKDFFQSGLYNPDCVDRSDESYSIDFWANCYKDPAFRCEEHACHPARGKAPLPCGDGQCVDDLRKCRNRRGYFIAGDLLPTSVSPLCWNSIAFLTKMSDTIGYTPCVLYDLDECASSVASDCPSIFQFPSEFIALGHVFFLYTNTGVDTTSGSIRPAYVCYDQNQCNMNATVMYNGSHCLYWSDLNFRFHDDLQWLKLVVNVERFFLAECSKNITSRCLDSEYYRCANSSRCISKRRLLDGVQDCMGNDDETLDKTCSLNHTFRFQCSDEPEKCISPVVLNDDTPDCAYGEDENVFVFRNRQSATEISFSMICDNFQELKPVEIDGRVETDETECRFWPCDTTYTRCNSIWNCPNGVDERHCSESSCRTIDRLCLSWYDYNQTCLFLNNHHQWRNHFLFVDESNLCINTSLMNNRFDCWTKKSYLSVPLLCELLHGRVNEQIKWPTALTHRLFSCKSDDTMPLRELQCYLSKAKKIRYPSYFSTDMDFSVNPVRRRAQRSFRFSESDDDGSNPWYCHRGLSIISRHTVEEYQCLCPPSYYGNQCQYQNQRVSLTLKILSDGEWRTVFAIVLLLIDEQGEIESFDQIRYVQMMECEIFKYNNYLLYRSRPKNLMKNYSIQIHAYNKHTLEYRASWLFPLAFLFLPVHRLAFQIIIPTSPPGPCSLPCGEHGQCFKYLNREAMNAFYCRCHQGWSGIQCTVKHDTCHLCADDSLCIESNVCLCPPEKYGPRCYLTATVCRSLANSCQNGGSCVASDQRRSTRFFICLCPNGFSGPLCDIVERKIIFSFHTDLIIPENMRVYLIGDTDLTPDKLISTFKRIPFHQTSVTLYTSFKFRFLFIALSSTDYYLTYSIDTDESSNRHESNRSIFITVQSSQRCSHVAELFNASVLSLHLLRRLKYYHLPCQQLQNLICFYDESYLCQCINGYARREARCYKSNHGAPNRCRGVDNGGCQNGAECFQDKVNCAVSLICNCPQCFYGSRCHFTTQGFGLSLDAIFGYQIQPTLSWSQQFSTVHASVALVTIILIIGLFGNFLSILTFHRRVVLLVGCGNYLLINAITSLLTVILLTLKFCFLLLSQMSIIVEESFLLFNCRLMDFLLHFCLSTSDWLSACVAVERVFVVLKGVNFYKERSQRVARWIIVFVTITVASSYLHDPIHRQLLNIPEEQRTWCIVNYGVSIRILDSFIFAFHFLVPFLINVISAVMIIVVAAGQRSIVRKEKTYRRHILDQLRLNQHLLISPCILVLLAAPRLVISLLTGCVNSTRAPWLLLIGYFVSFLPATLNFIVFVLPSKNYKDQCWAAIRQLRQRCWSNSLS